VSHVAPYQFEDGLPRRRLGEGGRKAEVIYCFSCQSKKRMTTTSVFRDPIMQALIVDRSLRVRWLRNKRSRSDGAMEYWSAGLLHLRPIAPGWHEGIL
jgi:hypothetical protein